MKTENLIALEVVTDDSSGTHVVGELDYSISCGRLDAYLERRGFEGRTELLAMLGFLSHKVCEYYIDLARKKNAANPAQQGE